MEIFRYTAMLAIGRAVFFGGFAISMVMLSFAYDYSMSLRAGAVMTLGMSAILLWFGQTAFSRKPERSEVWLLLKDDARPKCEASRKVFHQAMQETYYFFSYRACAISIVMLSASLFMTLLGINAGLM